MSRGRNPGLPGAATIPKFIDTLRAIDEIPSYDSFVSAMKAELRNAGFFLCVPGLPHKRAGNRLEKPATTEHDDKVLTTSPRAWNGSLDTRMLREAETVKIR